MDGAIWDGVTRRETLLDMGVALRDRLADAARRYDWDATLDQLAAHPGLVNSTRLGGRARYTALHQAAHGGAPVAVAKRLVELGAWRTYRNADGERSVDVARRRGHAHLLSLLVPVRHHEVPPDVLGALQHHFHAIIQGRAGRFVREHALRLPELEPLLELPAARMWFPVPGMYGGFDFQLERRGEDWALVAASWCRVAEGSGQRHRITRRGSALVEEGFV